MGEALAAATWTAERLSQPLKAFVASHVAAADPAKAGIQPRSGTVSRCTRVMVQQGFYLLCMGNKLNVGAW